MNEVSGQTASLVLDTLERRGIDPAELWKGLPITVAQMRSRAGRLDWSTWVAMMDRVAAVAPVPMDEMFIPGAGARQGHPYVQVAQGLLSLRDLYAFLARWGARRAFAVVRAHFEPHEPPHATFTMTIDPAREGSLPVLQFFAGILRNLPGLQGYGPATLTIASLTSHQATYELTLPPERSLLARTRRILGVLNGVSSTLDELEYQANEIATKNLELEAQLAASRERDEWLEVALDAGRIGLWRWDPATSRVRLGGRLPEWLGTGRTEIDTATWRERIHPDDQPAMAEVMRKAMQTGEAFQQDYRLFDAKGDTLWLHLTGHIRTDATGRLYAYGSATDITAEKLMETRLRTADRLIAAGTLAAGVAHEINNPLTYVLGSVELMQLKLRAHPAAAAATKDLLAQMLDGVDRIRAVVDDVRSFARQDEDAVGPVDPRVVCESAMRIVATDLRHRAMVVTSFDEDTPFVAANEAKLGQVLINLIVNASQAMPSRAVSENRIVVRTRKLAPGDAVIEVEDNGTGIAPETVPRLFDPFFTTKPIGLGTGLGLAVCQGIISSLGGRIDVTSEVGRGSKFSVVLPALARAATAPPEHEPAPTTACSSAHVLVIDDEPMIRNVVVRSLASHGYQVDEAANGREGLERALSGDERQVILCDLMMPDLDGAMLFDALSERRPELLSRIIFISGGAVTERIRAFIERPDIVVLHKPFALERLVAAIEHAAEARAPQGTSTSLPLT